MLGNVIQAMVNFDAKYVVADTLFRTAQHGILENYANKLQTEKMTEARNLYNETVKNARAEATETTKAEFAAIREKIKVFVTDPVPDGAMRNLETLRIMGTMVSESEIDLYMERYKDNYAMCRALSMIAVNAGHTRARFAVVSVEKLMDEVNGMEEYVLNAIHDYSASNPSYAFRVAIAPSGFLAALSTNLNAFMSGDFSAWGVVENIKPEKPVEAKAEYVPVP